MHTQGEKPDLDSIIATVGGMDAGELGRLAAAVDRRREDLATSAVLERRPHGSGVLQLETRRNPKTGSERGPYWYYKYRQGGRQRTEYVGKDLEAWMEKREGRADA